MQIDPAVRKHIEKFIALAKKYPVEFDKERRTPEREPDSYAYDVRRAKRYVYVRAGTLLHFLVDARTGLVYDALRRRCLRHGNIAQLVDENDWKQGLIDGDRNRAPVHLGEREPCEVCGRTAGVRATVLGDRCQYCRGADSRHIGSLRRLGAVPMLNGKPLGRYLKDD